MHFDSTEAFWERVRVPARLDLAKLLPASLRKGKRFETLDDARAYSAATQAVLRRTKREQYLRHAEALEDCANGDRTCAQPFCPCCARPFRRWLTANLLELANDAADAKVLTIFAETFETGRLCDADILLAQRRLRQRLRRCGFVGSLVIGGTEVSYSARTETWTLHFHVVVVDAKPNTIRLLIEKSAKDWRWAVKCEDLRDRVRQLSYLQKFSTFHRPGRARPGQRARAFPLPKAQLLELVDWLSSYRFEDFTFLFGARRRGKRIVRLNPA
ncbi:MAG: hypothetical protein WA733_13495 [Methylocystis sp.]|jgi:hypothetical protein